MILVQLHDSNTTAWSGFGGGGPPVSGDPLLHRRGPCIAALQHPAGIEGDQQSGDPPRSEPGVCEARPSLAPKCHLKTGAAGDKNRGPERFKRLSWPGKTPDGSCWETVP
ncbi:hypothetical protein TgHK011_009973 [Trichoderma gracile]|nr:hypothetical protein TgHK011_009973 [Trichoderma gracile]